MSITQIRIGIPTNPDAWSTQMRYGPHIGPGTMWTDFVQHAGAARLTGICWVSVMRENNRTSYKMTVRDGVITRVKIMTISTDEEARCEICTDVLWYDLTENEKRDLFNELVSAT